MYFHLFTFVFKDQVQVSKPPLSQAQMTIPYNPRNSCPLAWPVHHSPLALPACSLSAPLTSLQHTAITCPFTHGYKRLIHLPIPAKAAPYHLYSPCSSLHFNFPSPINASRYIHSRKKKGEKQRGTETKKRKSHPYECPLRERGVLKKWTNPMQNFHNSPWYQERSGDKKRNEKKGIAPTS